MTRDGVLMCSAIIEIDSRIITTGPRTDSVVCEEHNWIWTIIGELQKDVLMPILSFEVTILVDPARSHSQAAQASAAAKIRTTAANRKLVKFHKDICSQ